MNVTKLIVDFLFGHLELTLIGAFTLIQIAPIKINPWGVIFMACRKLMLGDIAERFEKLEENVDSLGNRIENLKDQRNEDRAVSARSRILRFGDEVFCGTKHSKEHFETIISDDIDFYEKYCAEHPDFKNNRTVLTTKRIMEIYEKLCSTHDFL